MMAALLGLALLAGRFVEAEAVQDQQHQRFRHSHVTSAGAAAWNAAAPQDTLVWPPHCLRYWYDRADWRGSITTDFTPVTGQDACHI